MSFLKKIFFSIIFFLILINNVIADDKIALIDISYIINNSNIGISTLKKLEKINEKNKNEIKKKRQKIKDQGNEIKKLQNVISQAELKKKIEIHKQNVDNFNNERNNLNKSFLKVKNKEMLNLVELVSPFVTDYMKKNSIDIVLKKETIYVSKSENDITEIILKIVNDKLK